MTTSLRARALRAFLRRTTKARAGTLRDVDARVVRASRERLESVARLVRAPRQVTVETLHGARVAGEWLHPPRPQAVGLYLHGGAYALGSPRLYRGLAGRLAAGARSTVFVADYRLAPEHPFPAALDDARDAWALVRERAAHGPHTWLAGDSAGGGLALALAQSLAAEGAPGPDAIALVSPWTDLTASGASVRENADRDHLLAAHLLAPVARTYLQGSDPADSRASPLFGPMAGLAPLRLHACCTEILRDDAVRVAERVRAAGGEVSMHLYPDLPHVFHLFAPWLPEANAAVADLAAWLGRPGARPVQ